MENLLFLIWQIVLFKLFLLNYKKEMIFVLYTMDLWIRHATLTLFADDGVAFCGQVFCNNVFQTLHHQFYCFELLFQ